MNPAADVETSVIAAFAGSFDPGQLLPGVVAPTAAHITPATPTWTIEGLPSGDYYLLVSYDNDDLVVAPSDGTEPMLVTLVDHNLAIPAIRVTRAIEAVSPDGAETVASPPTFVWKDGSDEDHYELRVFDDRGQVVWLAPSLPASSSPEVSATYAGPPLESGARYRFEVRSIDASGIALSRSEDLRGIFEIQ